MDAGLTRVGILEYRNPDGSIRREFRPPEEVFHPESLASLAGAPVLDGHSTWVTPETFSTHSRGHVVEGTPRQDGELVAADLVVQDAGTLKRVERRDLSEISCGYTCGVIDPTPGEWNGKRYDCVQRAIRYNHVALLPAGTGRAGRECALRLDAAEPVSEAYAELVANIQRMDPTFRTDGLSEDYLRGALDYLRGDRSGVFSDAGVMQREHVRAMRAAAGERGAAPGIRQDGSFVYQEVEHAACEEVRELWREPSPFATKPERATRAHRADADPTFTPDDARQASHDAARNAWCT